MYVMVITIPAPKLLHWGSTASHRPCSGPEMPSALVGRLDKPVHQRAVRLEPVVEPRIVHRQVQVHGGELLGRSPHQGEGILFIGNAESPELRNIERVADVGEPVEALQPPDCEGRPAASARQIVTRTRVIRSSWRSRLRSNPTNLRRRTTHRRSGHGWALVLCQHEKARLQANRDSGPEFHAILTTACRLCNDNCQRTGKPGTENGKRGGRAGYMLVLSLSGESADNR